MDLRTTKEFDKKLKDLSRDKKLLVLDALDLFRENPEHPSLRNHPLKGSMTGKRSLSVFDNLRIIFVEKGGYIQVLMLDVGDHDTVYFD